MAENVLGLSPSLIIHPGETIKELIETRNMSQEELAIRTGYSAKHISQIINGKKDISSRFANRLEYVFGISTEFWINLQGIYDKEIVELENLNNITDKELEVLLELKDIVKYCENKGIIEKNTGKQITILNMRKFLNINDLCMIPNLPLQQVAFRGSKSNKVNIYVLYAWQKICEYYTNKINVKNIFDKNKLITKYDEIKSTMFLSTQDMIKKLKDIFSECGIAFDVIEHFTGAPVQGFIQKLNNKVILCMTLRKTFCDIFWFTLFHEIYHLINEDFSNQYIDYSFIDSEQEKQADNFAKNQLINENDYIEFITNENYHLYKNIKIFAKTQNVIPSIVIGRIQKEKNNYKFLSQYKEQYKLN